jgi:hypothetical protein
MKNSKNRREANLLAKVDFFAHINQRNLLYSSNINSESIDQQKKTKKQTCGVVMTTAPVKPQLDKYCASERCSSEVPGGVSMTWMVS